MIQFPSPEGRKGIVMRNGLPLLLLTAAAFATPVEQEIAVQGTYLDVTIAPGEGGVIHRFAHRAVPGNLAGAGGILQEGFGVPSPYVPNRRLNEQLEIVDAIADRPVMRYSYDCEGGNIRGLHVTRTMEPLIDEASLRVTWRIENRGTEAQWVAPWVRNDVAPGGSFSTGDLLECPTERGIRRIERSGYNLAARNWVAAMDPIEKSAVYAVFNADHVHSFLSLWEPDDSLCGFQTAFVPRFFKPGDSWETVYRVNIVRGLSHINFATDEFAAQIDHTSPETIEILIAAVKTIPTTIIDARVLAADGQIWKLPRKRFSADANTVIRCSYTWPAPANGSFEFLAELRQEDGQPYLAGHDTGSPHGGIDAQFVVGGAPPGPLEPWTDAPFALKQSPRALRRSMAAPWDDPLVWFESPLDKVFRDDDVQPEGNANATVRVALARNERESFQLVFRPSKEKTIENVDCRVHDLVNEQTGARIPAANIARYNVAYTPVIVPSNFEGPTADWPDALTPFAPFRAAGGECTPVWFTVYAPPDLPAGIYSGMLEVIGSGIEPLELWIEAEVYDFALPSTPALKTDFGFSEEAAAEAANRGGWTRPLAALLARYRDNALEHRVTLRELTALPEPRTNYPAELEAFAPELKSWIEHGVTTVSTPVKLLDTPDQLRQADAFAAAQHIDNRVFWQAASDPPSPAWIRILEGVQQWKDIAPHIPVMATAAGLEPFLAAPVDIWTIHLPLLDTLHGESVLDRIRTGGEVWCYVDETPPRPYGNFYLDQAAIEHRILFWQTWSLGIRGFHYWCVNAVESGRDPFASLLDATPVNGDGILVYPGPEGPINSLRWEVIRDGIEDYDYLTLLAERLRAARQTPGRENDIAKAEQALDLHELVPDLVKFPRDPAKMEAKRRDIAQAIVTLGQTTPLPSTK